MKVFISYRREDSKWPARDVYRALTAILPEDDVFMDIDTIRPGEDFVAALEGWVRRCDVLLALIGSGWLEASDPETGRPRLEDPQDFVRIEIREALRRGVPVVPLLLDGADMPRAENLPEDIAGLSRRQAEYIEHRTADGDVARLIAKLGLDAPPATAPARAVAKPRWPVPEMVRIAPGEFSMGAGPGDMLAMPNEAPKHYVRVGYGFEIGKYAVTFEEYDAFCATTGRAPPEDCGWGRGRRPVIHVSDIDAEAYCAWLNEQFGYEPRYGYRLPSEAEWEYAARAGDDGLRSVDRPFATGTVSVSDYFFDHPKEPQTVEVGSFPANPWGLHEIYGNVWEWCGDCWNDTYEGAPCDGSAWRTGDCSVRVIRGGSWGIPEIFLHSAARSHFFTGSSNSRVGFRVARAL